MFFTKKVSAINVPKGRKKAEILNGLYSYIASVDQICNGEKLCESIIN